MSLDHRALDRAGARFVHCFSSLFREASTGRVPAAGLDQLNEAAWRLVELVGAARIQIEAEGAWVNDHLVHLPEPLWSGRDSLAQSLAARGVGGVSIQGVAEVDEWTALMRVLLTADLSSPGVGPLNRVLGEGPLRLLPPTRRHHDEGAEITDLGTRALRHQATAQWAVDLYLRSLRTVRRMLAGDSDLLLPELVQELLELADDSPRHLLAFVTARTDAPYALRHPVNTALLSILMGKELALTPGARLDLGLSALACDVGMTRVDPAILEAARSLTQEELLQIREHPLYSALDAMGTHHLDNASARRIRVALEQHMEPKGQGYPALPHWGRRHLFSRIIGVADSYDAMVADQSWRQGLLPDRALAQLVREAGRRLEPALVTRFARMIGRYPVGTVVLLQTGEVGVVYAPPESEEHLLRPIVRLVTGAEDDRGPDAALVDLRDRSPAGVHRRTIMRSVAPDQLGIDVLSVLFGPV